MIPVKQSSSAVSISQLTRLHLDCSPVKYCYLHFTDEETEA